MSLAKGRKRGKVKSREEEKIKDDITDLERLLAEVEMKLGGEIEEPQEEGLAELQKKVDKAYKKASENEVSNAMRHKSTIKERCILHFK